MLQIVVRSVVFFVVSSGFVVWQILRYEKKGIDPKARIVAIIGDRVDLTKTSLVFPQWLQRLKEGDRLDSVLIPLQVTTESLKTVVNGLRSCQNFDGAVITKPHKEAILSLCDKLTPEAKAIGAVNCFRNHNGLLIGANFDGIGFCDGLKMNLKEKRCLILGAGGAARAIIFSLLERQAVVSVYNRSYQRALRLIDLSPAVTVYQTFPFALLEHGDLDIIINATPLGHSPDDPLPIPDEKKTIQLLRPPLVVADVIMNPAETRFLTEAKRNGCKIHHGRHMLEAQSHRLASFLATQFSNGHVGLTLASKRGIQ